MRAAKFLKCEPCSTSGNTERGKITAVSQILEVNGEQAIEISLFHKGVLKGRYFANEDGYNAWINGTWRICKLNNAARVCMGKEPVKSYYCDLDDCIAWESIEDKQRALDFLDTWRIGVYEDEINEANRQKAMERKVDRINDMMAEIPCVPDKVEDWLDQKIFPGHILFIKKVGKRTTYSCTACGCSSWKKKGWKHGEKTSCPKCGQLVTANSRQQEKVRKAPVILLQQYGEKWVERQFKTICRWSAGKKEIQMFEEIRAIIPKGKDWGKVWYGTRIEADEFEQDFWDRNQRANKKRLKGYTKLDQQIQERLPEVQKYFWEDKTHMIIPAGNCEELMTEGQTLHHCVGSSDQYMKKMAAGETWILFLRKKEDLEKAYYTVEINMKDDRIIQYYSAFDRQPDKETISEVLKRFKQSIKAKRVRITVPVTNIA